MNNNYPKHTKFPLKKCLIASVVILIVASLVLTLLLSITTNNPNDTLAFVLMIIFVSTFGCLLLGYWIYQIVRYIGIRKDEK